MLRLRHYRSNTDGFVKVTILVLVILAAMGAGWMYYELSDDLTLGIRITNADLTQGDQLPITLDVKLISEKGTDIHINWVDVKVYAEKDGALLMSLSDQAITVPAHGEVIRTYDVVLVNLDKVENYTIYIVVNVQHEGGTDHIEQEVNLDAYL